MGDEADDMLRGQNLDKNEQLEYSVVKESFGKFFVPKKNVIYERARFNQRLQQVNETVYFFGTSL